jgi:hypothetical protein
MDGTLPEMMRVAAMIGTVGLILSVFVFWKLRLAILLAIISGSLAIGYEVLTRGLYQTLFEMGRGLYILGVLFVLVPPLMRLLRRKKMEELELKPTTTVEEEVEETEGVQKPFDELNFFGISLLITGGLLLLLSHLFR